MAIIKIGSLVKGDHKAAKSSIADYFRSGSVDEGEECLADLHDSLKNGKRFQDYFIAGYGEVVYNSKTAKYADAIREEKKIHSDDAHAIIVNQILEMIEMVPICGMDDRLQKGPYVSYASRDGMVDSIILEDKFARGFYLKASIVRQSRCWQIVFHPNDKK